MGLVDNKVCAIDATWTGLRFVWRRAMHPNDNLYSIDTTPIKYVEPPRLRSTSATELLSGETKGEPWSHEEVLNGVTPASRSSSASRCRWHPRRCGRP